MKSGRCSADAGWARCSAHDARLGRDVAVKILPPLFTLDPDRLARFEREARARASLNHPHIGAIYGVENAVGADGGTVRALVLELVEAETLAEYLARSASDHGGVSPAAAPDIAADCRRSRRRARARDRPS